MPEFRGHHLVCFNFFKGKGYSKRFVDNLTRLLQRAECGEPVTIVTGPDDACRACPHLNENRCSHKPGSDAAVDRMDEMTLDYLQLKPGEKVSWENVKAKINTIPGKWYDVFCQECEWFEICRVTF